MSVLSYQALALVEEWAQYTSIHRERVNGYILLEFW
jgi:hypothetical protein